MQRAMDRLGRLAQAGVGLGMLACICGATQPIAEKILKHLGLLNELFGTDKLFNPPPVLLSAATSR